MIICFCFLTKIRQTYELHCSLNAFPAVNFGLFDALIWISSPVLGLRPSRAARSVNLKVPNPTMEIFLPAATSYELRNNNNRFTIKDAYVRMLLKNVRKHINHICVKKLTSEIVSKIAASAASESAFVKPDFSAIFEINSGLRTVSTTVLSSFFAVRLVGDKLVPSFATVECAVRNGVDTNDSTTVTKPRKIIRDVIFMFDRLICLALVLFLVIVETIYYVISMRFHFSRGGGSFLISTMVMHVGSLVLGL